MPHHPSVLLLMLEPPIHARRVGQPVNPVAVVADGRAVVSVIPGAMAVSAVSVTPTAVATS